MHNTSAKYLLQIEPKKAKEKIPIEDKLTIKMEILLKNAIIGTHYRGFHMCHCGEISETKDLIVGNYITNSLAAHYLRWHRAEIPRSEIEKLKKEHIMLEYLYELLCVNCNQHIDWITDNTPRGSVYCDFCKEIEENEEG